MARDYGPEWWRRREFLLASGAAVSSSVLLAGCIGDDDDEVTPTPTPTPTPTEQTLHMTQQVEPAHDYDPVVLNDAYSGRIANHLYDGLYEYGEAFDIQPKLAVDAPEVEDDGLRYIVEIVDDAEFHNGDPVTAEDVLHSFIAPVHEVTDNVTSFDMLDIEASTTIDEHTVQFDLLELYAPFETMTVATNIANKALRLAGMDLTEEEWWDHDFVADPRYETSPYNQDDPIGSGPFRYVDHEPGDFFDMVRWDDYWGEPLPILESVRWVATEDDSARAAQVLAGDTDAITGVPPGAWETLDNADGVIVHNELSVSYFYAAYNINEGPTTNPDVRNGIEHAFSMTDFVEGVIGPAGANAISPLPEPLLNTWDLPADEYAAMENEFDPDAAEDLLSGNVPDPWEPRFITPPDDIREALAEDIALRLGALEGVNIDASVVRMDWPTLLATYNTGNEDDYALYTLGWTGGPDPDAYMWALFHESSAGLNQGHFYDPDTDFHDRLREARETPDFDVRREAYDDVIREILQEKVHTPGYNLMNSIGALPRVQDVEVHTSSSLKPRLLSAHHNTHVE